MPDISTCKICESTLKAKVEELGQVANNAVFHHDLSETVEEESDTDDGTDDDGTDDDDDDADGIDVQSGEKDDEQAINNLLQRIRMWQRANINIP